MADSPKKLQVLFLCTGNSCRSQMAEGWARHLKGSEMAEAGVDISGHRSKTLESLADQAFDVVVTVCADADASCPAFGGSTRVVHVGFDDPPRLAKDARDEHEALAHYRRVRDEIRSFIMTLPQSILPGGANTPPSNTKRQGEP